MVRVGCGGSGKVRAAVVRLGDTQLDHGEFLCFLGLGGTPASYWRFFCARNRGKLGRVSAVLIGMGVRGREKRMERAWRRNHG